MKRIKPVLLLFLFFVSAVNVYAEKAPQRVVDLANTVLVEYGKDLVIISAVKDQNAKGTSLAQIQTLDVKWRGAPGVVDYMRAMMDSECGKYLKKIQTSQKYFAEIFVMDNQGANVAMTDKTSDYWQGDEAKFQKSFSRGDGAVFVDEIEFDESTQSYQVQISVPVIDDGKAIGAITFGIDIENID